MPKVFDVDKYERYKTRVEVAQAVYQAISEDFRLERDELSKMLSFFNRDFHPSNKHYAEAYEAVNKASKTHLAELPAIETEVKRILALAEDGSQHQKHLRPICAQIVKVKRAEIKRDAAAQRQQNLGAFWRKLDALARRHLELGQHTGPIPMAGHSPAMAGGYYGE
jgi:hypothetical protein